MNITKIKSKLIPVAILGLLFSCSNQVIAGEQQDRKLQAVPQLESAFLPDLAVSATTIAKNYNNVAWLNTGITLKINNQWQLSIKSQQDIIISKLAITLNNVTVANQVNLKISKGVTTNYMFASAEFIKNLQDIIGGYKLVGIVGQVSANDYMGYEDYVYRIVKVNISYIDTKNNYNETMNNFMLVVAK